MISEFERIVNIEADECSHDVSSMSQVLAASSSGCAVSSQAKLVGNTFMFDTPALFEEFERNTAQLILEPSHGKSEKQNLTRTFSCITLCQMVYTTIWRRTA